jgi:putative ABC transport system permease protein
MGGSIRVMAVLASAVTTNSGSPLCRFTTMALAVKTGFADPMRIVPEVRSAVLAVNPRIALADTQSMDTIVSTSTARIEFTTTLLGVAAAIALLLSALGLYGVVGYAVNRRTREIGVRIAVGAGPGQVEGLFVRQALVLAGFGLLGGVALALATTRLPEGILYGVAPTDAATFATAGGALAAIVFVASWLPARRAARVNPLAALRHN